MITHFDMRTGAIIDTDDDTDPAVTGPRAEPMPALRLLSVAEANTWSTAEHPTPSAVFMLPIDRLIGA